MSGPRSRHLKGGTIQTIACLFVAHRQSKASSSEHPGFVLEFRHQLGDVLDLDARLAARRFSRPENLKARGDVGAVIGDGLLGEGTVCDGKSKPKSRDRIVAQCFLDKLDIAEEMAKSGTACDWPKFWGGHYKISDATCSRK